MDNKSKNCENCNVLFEYKANPNFPDKRKYCDKCSAVKKAEWEASQKGNGSQQAPKPQNEAVVQRQHNLMIQRTEKPHSYECGKAGNRHKIYYGTIAELKEHLRMLKAEGLLDDEEISF